MDGRERNRPGLPDGGEVLELSVEGDLDAATLRSIADEVARLLASGGDVVVDLSGATLVGAPAERFAGA